ncbi:MAG: exodeoxyribonuclease VII large subunit [Clostridiaceae bacterium]|nr:exodeoxyribonuclease VII large subunit [Clostridiaceae bacterium]
MDMAITVTQLNRYIKTLLEGNPQLSYVTVSGELSNYKQHTSGHCYMTLKDETSAIRAVMFKSAADKLRFLPENGTKVIAKGKISVYERDGQYQLYISSMQPDGVGALFVAFEQLKKKLEQLGYFEDENKKPIPKFPHTIGVITSPTGAAVRDIVNVATRRYPLAEIVVFPVLVQGEGAAKQIADAIDYFNTKNAADVLIVGRGGGSIEELWAFNEEVVAHSIYRSSIPVISAVGHETDFTIADFVADLRAPTPSAAAELAAPSKEELMELLRQNYRRMYYSLTKTIQNRREILARFAMRTPMDTIDQLRILTDNTVKYMINATTAVLDARSKRLAVAASALGALSPLGVLERGYSVAQKDKKIIRSVKQVTTGDEISLKLIDGDVLCEVKS